MTKFRIVQEGPNGTIEFSGRVIGFIDDEECRAVINSTDAAKKIFTSQSITFCELSGNCFGKRLVIASGNFYKDRSRVVHISPKVKSVCYGMEKKVFGCYGSCDYTIYKSVLANSGV